MACSEDEIDSYKSDRYLYFSKPEVLDSATFLSFSHYPGATEKTVRVEVTLIGDLLTENTTYQLEIDKDSTTADPANYDVNLTQTFSAGQTKDFIDVKLFNKDLAGKEVTLYLRIVENENFSPGLKSLEAPGLFSMTSIVNLCGGLVILKLCSWENGLLKNTRNLLKVPA